MKRKALSLPSWVDYTEPKAVEESDVMFSGEILVHIMSFMTIENLLKVLKFSERMKEYENIDSLWENVARRQIGIFCSHKPFDRTWKWLCLSIYSINIYRVEGDTVIKYDVISPYLEYLMKNFVVSNRGNNNLSFSCRDGIMLYDITYKYVNNCDIVDSCQFELYWDNIGNMYQGESKEGVKEGLGIYTYENGNVYNGEWIKDKKNGYGNEVYNHGAVYKGNWQNNKFHGKGEYIFAGGDIMIGNYVSGYMYGYGKYIHTDGCIYKGNFVHDNEQGKGTMEWPNGMKHIGMYENNTRSGHGILTWPDGDKFEGIWINDTRSGPGIFYNKNGSIESQVWDGFENPVYGLVIPLKISQSEISIFQ